MFAPFEIIDSTITRHYRDTKIKIVKKTFGDLDRPLELIRRHQGEPFPYTPPGAVAERRHSRARGHYSARGGGVDCE